MNDGSGWRYPRTRLSLPESHGSVGVPRTATFWRKPPRLRAAAWSVAGVIMGLNAWLLVGVAREWMG
ncbi:MAG TPA: hypothetical protein VMN37_11170 [Gemmatimonadales bacterium]|nr:hypothetical protein [Gemmatimonadales bacterium]